MKYARLPVFLLFLTSLCIPGYGQPDNTKAKSLLWRISSKQMKTPSYLFGTIHMICPEDYVWTEAMRSSLKKSNAVSFEMDLDAPEVFIQASRGMINNTGKDLQDYFTPTDYSKLEAYMRDSIGLDVSVFQQVKPVALQSLLMEKALGCASVSYEMNIMQEAKSQKKEILGLERADEQLDLFDNLPADSIAKEMMDFIEGGNDEKQLYRELVAAYKSQDLPALHRLIQRSEEHDIDLDGFIDVRNEKWIPRMIGQMDQQSVFFAVGAGHLWGKNGLISLLRKAGYTVEPVK